MKQAALFLKLGLLSTVMVLFPVLFLAGSLACAQSTSKNSLNLSKELQNLEHLKVYPADSQPAFDIRLEPKATYQDGGDVLFGRQLTSIKIDEKGRVYVLDFGQQTIHVFNPDGSFLKDVGRKGRGPGEFLYIADMQIDDENLYVLDSHQTKISVFKEGSFKHLRDVNISLKNTDPQPAWLARTRKNKTFYRPNNFIVRPDGKYLIIFNDNAVAVAFNLPGRTDEFSLFDPAKGAYIKHNVLTFKWTGGVLIHKKGGRSDILFNVPYK